MALFTKCIFKDKEVRDGIRMSIMSRHTLNDGRTPDPRITAASFDEHQPTLAPPPRLIGDYYWQGIGWEEFEKRFLAHLAKKSVADAVRSLAQRALIKDVTLLCVEDTPERCHRRIVALECQRCVPELVVEHH